MNFLNQHEILQTYVFTASRLSSIGMYIAIVKKASRHVAIGKKASRHVAVYHNVCTVDASECEWEV